MDEKLISKVDDIIDSLKKTDKVYNFLLEMEDVISKCKERGLKTKEIVKVLNTLLNEKELREKYSFRQKSPISEKKLKSFLRSRSREDKNRSKKENKENRENREKKGNKLTLDKLGVDDESRF